MLLNNKYIYFLGIGGIGMSALAQYFHELKYVVAGYDRVRNDNCKRLETFGINTHYEDKLSNIPANYLDKKNTIVIITPAIPHDNAELMYFKQNGFTILKRSEVLKMISASKKCIAISGSHGKTSVTGITANIMSQTKLSCSAFLGGILKNINSNLIVNPQSDFIVVEADEFDRSFHQLQPSTSFISYIEPDHLDIYNTYENLKDAFIYFANLTYDGGNLVINYNLDSIIRNKIKPSLNVFTYSIDNKKADFFAYNIRYVNSKCYFSISCNGCLIEDIEYSIGGNHNIENALAASAIAFLNGATNEDIRRGLTSFKGMLRRFDIKVHTSNYIYIDDYAHHPTEISAFLKSVKLLYPQKKITAIFQPHLYSRTADFYKEFAEALSLADEIILLPIYPARELPIYGIDSQNILELIKSEHKFLCDKTELLSKIKEINPELLVTMGAGDIDAFVDPITQLLS